MEQVHGIQEERDKTGTQAQVCRTAWAGLLARRLSTVSVTLISPLKAPGTLGSTYGIQSDLTIMMLANCAFRLHLTVYYIS